MSKAKGEIFFENTSPIRMKSIPNMEGRIRNKTMSYLNNMNQK